MSALKSVTFFSRLQIAASSNGCSAFHWLSGKSSLQLECNAKFSRNMSLGRQCLQQPSNACKELMHPQKPGCIKPFILTASRGQDVSSLPDADSRLYICPSRLSQLFTHLVINDNLTNMKSSYDCPFITSINVEKITPTHNHNKVDILEPPEIEERNTTNIKEAKEIMRIRHRKMKKHKLRKLRKRMYFLWKRQKAKRKAKRDGIYWDEIANIKQHAVDFDAEAFVKDQLDKARKGGFYLKVFDPKTSCNS